jgi:hypothetical protein
MWDLARHLFQGVHYTLGHLYNPPAESLPYYLFQKHQMGIKEAFSFGA